MKMPLPRRTFLRAAGVTISLPLLDAMLPIGRGAEQQAAAMRGKRMVLIGRPLGLHTPFFFPERTGRDYQSSRYLKILDSHRNDFTVFSGLAHLGYSGHGAMAGLFTGADSFNIRQGNMRNSISLDQVAAQHIGTQTRYAYLALGGGSGLSWNAKGIRIPAEDSPASLFKKLFVNGTPAEVAREIQQLQTGHSILDSVREQAKSLSQSVGAADRNRLDTLLSSIREAERHLQQEQDWVERPKPKVDVSPYSNDAAHMLERSRRWMELASLALQTDLTRVMTIYLHSHASVEVDGRTIAHHDMSHHGRDEKKIEQLAVIEEAELRIFNDFLGRMKSLTEGGQSLLDQTMVFYATSLSNASAHTCGNLPLILAGGGFKHGAHLNLALDPKRDQPLSNLYVRMLQKLEIETDRFGTSTSVVSEI